MYTVHHWWTLQALDQHVGGAAHHGPGVVLHGHVVVHQVLPAVGATDVEAEASPLDVEAIEHEDGSQDIPVQLLKYSGQLSDQHWAIPHLEGGGVRAVRHETDGVVLALHVVSPQPDGVLGVGASEEVLGELHGPFNQLGGIGSAL